jgi:lysylphosphatidylglycerol synthetase-like protein (DUF2156 family)
MFIPIRDLWWLAAGGGAGYGARYLKLRIDAAVAARRRRQLRMQTLYGYNPHSLVSIAPGAQFWSTPDIDGAIIYSEFGKVWLAAGDPLTAREDRAELARQFAADARKKGRVVAFVPASSDFAQLATLSGFTAVKAGASPYFDLQTWNPRGDAAKKLRAGVNQARRAGVTVEVISGEISDTLKQETASLCLRWLEARRAGTSFGWLVALDPFLHSDHKKYFAARVDGKLVGFLAASPIPTRKAWYLEDVLRLPDAPPGTATLLVFEALTALKSEGVSLATLGTVPLAEEGDDIALGEHPRIERTFQLAARNLGDIYNFEGLRRFKGKFVPTRWESEYILSQRGVMIPARVGHAIVRALVPSGLTHVTKSLASSSQVVNRTHPPN